MQTGVFPSLAPFAHALAAVLTAALNGSILFVTSSLEGIFQSKKNLTLLWFDYSRPIMSMQKDEFMKAF